MIITLDETVNLRMNSHALKHFRQRLRDNQPTVGLWVTLESPSVTEIAVALGCDWVVIDAEHGHLDWKEIVEHLRCTVRSQTVALVRVAELNASLIKRALDIGADGVVVPFIESAEQLKQAISFARYPLDGVRGIGAERATCWGQCFEEHTAAANEEVLVVPILETTRALRQVPSLAQVAGSEVFFFGPADYSASAGYRGQWEGPGVAEQIVSMKDQLIRAGKHCGIVSTSLDNLVERREQGFRMIALGIDTGLLIRSLRGALTAVGRDRRIGASFEVSPTTQTAPLARPPESMRPDRPEVMTEFGKGEQVELVRGVTFECLVGKPNRARNLTTGIVTFAPGAELPYHTHPFTESITVLAGRMTIEVQGRLYELGPRDNITIPREHAHTARNRGSTPARVHASLGSDTPTRTLVETYFPRRVMPLGASAPPGAERVTYYQTANKFTAGPNATFIDFFNAELMPGLEMSGGYGLFEPGGRLPAHVHDFDESICIISGRATCVVEGRRYSMADLATALEPRGRVHYFINESSGPMEMIWVYAGPRPERIVVDERCATVAGDPWK